MIYGNVMTIDRGWDDVMKEISEFENATVKCGVLSDSDKDLLLIAGVNEFGTDSAGRGNSVKIPPRPFIGTIIERNKREIDSFIAARHDEVITKKRKTKQALDLVGLFGVKLIQKNIRDGGWEPNSEVTIALKGSSRPLIDTGGLIQSIRHEVDK